MKKSRLASHAVILAGGRGTRFWPRSRIRTPKQLLNIVGNHTMLAQTVARLRPAFTPERIWVVTNEEQADGVRRQLPRVPRSQILVEPVGRNTAAAIGLAAIHLIDKHKDALMAVLPADHYVGRPSRFLGILRAALQVARSGPNLVVLGVPPTRPETGYGYIERAGSPVTVRGCAVHLVWRFTEKPSAPQAKQYFAAERFLWNAGMFFWQASTYLAYLGKFLKPTHRSLMKLADTIGTPRYPRSLARLYPRLKNISVDYAVMEPATRNRGPRNVFVLPAEVGWSDIGSWAAVYELMARSKDENVSAGRILALDSSSNYFWSPHKLVAAIGVKDLVIVETPDAILVCPRQRSQDVSRVVKWLEENKLYSLL